MDDRGLAAAREGHGGRNDELENPVALALGTDLIDVYQGGDRWCVVGPCTREAAHVQLYSPNSHNLRNLRRRAEGILPRMIDAWPRDSRFSRRCFERLERAYVVARYSPKFEIKQERSIGWWSPSRSCRS